MQIAILTKPADRSPKILADSLKDQLWALGINATIYHDIKLLNSQVSFRDSGYSFQFWLRERFFNLNKYLKLQRSLKKYDAVIVSECSPNAFWRKMHNIEKLKRSLRKPVLLYEVYYLENAPSQVNTLRNNGDPGLDRYDYYLSVTDITEIKVKPSSNWYPIGLYSMAWGLSALPKKDFVAIIDFAQPGYEDHREMQIRTLQKLDIKYISLERNYTVEDIRKIYQQGAIYFMQSSEAFGLPILECLCCGNQVFAPSSKWPMSWRLDENPEIQGECSLPGCFTVYKNEAHLIRELVAFKESYDFTETPKKIFNIFKDNYPSFYYGNDTELKKALKAIELWPARL